MKKLLTKKKKGFTLIELIVVMAVIGILVLLATPRFLGYTKDANVTAMQSDAKVLSNASLMYNIDNENFPIDEATPYTVAELETANPDAVDYLEALGFNPVAKGAVEESGVKGELGYVPASPAVDADTVAKLDPAKLGDYVKNIKGKYEDYVLVTSGALEGEVFHIAGVSDKEGNPHFGVK